MVKILHCADFHLDTPFHAKDSAKGVRRRQDLRDVFVLACDTALQEKADFLLIAGDLFDRNFITDETAKLLVAQFARLNGKCRVIISAGNHDPYQPDSPYQKLDFSENVYLFQKETLSYFDFPDKHCRIYGYAFCDRFLPQAPIASFSPDPDYDGITVLCAHTEFDNPTSRTAPILKSELEKAAFDYAALGHIHKYAGMQSVGKTHYCYCGSADGLDFGECGKKSFLYVELAQQAHKVHFSYEEIPSSPRHYEILPIDITGANHNLDAIEPIKRAIAENGFGENTALRVLLRGNVAPDFYFSEAVLLPYIEGLLHLEIKNETNPFFDCRELEADIGIRGALYRQLRDKLQSEEPDDRAMAQRALQYGLCALSGNEFPTNLPTEADSDAP